jgi:hypothetical protein
MTAMTHAFVWFVSVLSLTTMRGPIASKTDLTRMARDHTRLTYKFQGRDFRLTDVSGRVLKEILA